MNCNTYISFRTFLSNGCKIKKGSFDAHVAENERHLQRKVWQGCRLVANMFTKIVVTTTIPIIFAQYKIPSYVESHLFPEIFEKF